MSCSSIIDSNASWRRALHDWFCSCSIEYPNDKLTQNWSFMFETFSLVECKHSPLFFTWPTFHWRRIDIFLGAVRVIRRFGSPKWSTKVLRTCCWCKTSSRVISTVLGPGALGGIFKDCGGFGCLEGCWCWHEGKHLYCYIAWKSCIPTYHGE